MFYFIYMFIFYTQRLSISMNYEKPPAGTKQKGTSYLVVSAFIARFGNIDYCSPLRARISVRGDAAHVPQVNRRPSFSSNHEDKAKKKKKKPARRNY